MLSFLCCFVFLGKLILNSMKLKPVFNRIVVEVCAPLLATSKGVIIPDIASPSSSPNLGLGLVIDVGEGVDLKAGDKVLYIKSAAVCYNVGLVSVDILKVGEVLAVVCDD